MTKWIVALACVALLALPAATEPGNRMAQYGTMSGVRGYTCEIWNSSMSPNERAAYLLGMIAIVDALRHAAGDDNHSLTQRDCDVLRLPRSANEYSTLVSTACLSLPSSTPVIVALFVSK